MRRALGLSLEYDRDVKIPLYARAGIREAWLIDLVAGAIEVYRDPSEMTENLSMTFDVTRPRSPGVR